MKNKPFFRSFLTLLFALICMGGVSVTAYAQGNDIPTDDSGVIMETEPQPLTPEGNMSLVDDISGEASGDKQFIVVQSKGGNYFYIVIDHAAEGENTVHFLNQVDEADLMAIIGEEETTAPAVCTCTDKCVAGAINTTCPVCSVTMSACTGVEKQTEPEQTEEPQEKPNKNIGGLVIFLVVAALGGGGAFYYFKIWKPKQNVKGSTDLDEFDFEDYDEDEPEETDDDTGGGQERPAAENEKTVQLSGGVRCREPRRAGEGQRQIARAGQGEGERRGCPHAAHIRVYIGIRERTDERRAG